MSKLTRRNALILAGIGALGVAALRPGENGEAQNTYFQNIAAALRKAQLQRPTLVIDRQALAHNIQRLKQHLPEKMAYRVVAKSLPSVELIEAVLRETQSQHLMVFHQPFIEALARQVPDADQLLGKPMPVSQAALTLNALSNSDLNSFVPSRDIQWLVDSNERLREYAALAEGRGDTLNINLEIDVGLHRGGFSEQAELQSALQFLRDSKSLKFTGFMGYEPHIVKVPELAGGGEKAFEAAQQIYRDALELARKVWNGKLDESSLTLNTGGSGTFQMYKDRQSPANELAMGSGLVMPTSFDLPTLNDHKPAAFIATPVLKANKGIRIPGLEWAAPALEAWNPNWQRSYFTYGGYWKATPVSPKGLSPNALYGRSTNQELLNGSNDTGLSVGDTVFLRPQQSEFVFLQFGDIAVYDNGNITELWPVLQNS